MAILAIDHIDVRAVFEKIDDGYFRTNDDTASKHGVIEHG